MKLAFSTNAFVRRSLLEAVAEIGRIGYPGVEILADRPHLFPPTTSREEVARLKEVLEEHGLAVSNLNANTATGYYRDAPPEPFFEPALASADEGRRRWRIDYTRRCLELARELGSPNISVTSGRSLPGCPPERGWELLVDSLREIVRQAEALGVGVGIEYEPTLLIENAEEVLRLLEDIPSPCLGVNLDIGHSHLAGEDTVQVIHRMGDRIFNLHLEDIRGRKHYHLLPGLGEIDFRRILQALVEVGYRRFVTVELYSYVDGPEEEAAKALEYLNRIGYGGTQQ